MDPDTTDAAWYQLQLEQQRFEEEQALLRADAGFEIWLDTLMRETHENE